MSDPFLTAAERCVAGIPDRYAPSRPPFIDPAEPHPHVIAEKGYVPAPGWPRAYYLDPVDGWIDTETRRTWQCPSN